MMGDSQVHTSGTHSAHVEQNAPASGQVRFDTAEHLAFDEYTEPPLGTLYKLCSIRGFDGIEQARAAMGLLVPFAAVPVGGAFEWDGARWVRAERFMEVRPIPHPANARCQCRAGRWFEGELVAPRPLA